MAVEHLEVHPAILIGDVLWLAAIFLVGGIAVGAAGEERLRVGAGGAEFGGDPGLVMNFDEEGAPALLDQDRFGRPVGDFDARFGIDLDADERIGIENFLGFFGGIIATRCEERVEGFAVVGGERRALVIECLDQATDAGGGWLPLNFVDVRELLGGGVNLGASEKAGAKRK